MFLFNKCRPLFILSLFHEIAWHNFGRRRFPMVDQLTSRLVEQNRKIWENLKWEGTPFPKKTFRKMLSRGFVHQKSLLKNGLRIPPQIKDSIPTSGWNPGRGHKSLQSDALVVIIWRGIQGRFHPEILRWLWDYSRLFLRHAVAVASLHTNNSCSRLRYKNSFLESAKNCRL